MLKIATPPRHGVLKAKLAANRMTTPLFDVQAYTLALEQLYEEMWRQRLAGEHLRDRRFTEVSVICAQKRRAHLPPF